MDLATIKRRARRAQGVTRRALESVTPRQPESKIIEDAAEYWSGADDTRWRSDSHWRDGDAFAENDIWPEIGRRHLGMFERGRRALDVQRPWGRVLEWGCGGGANAVHFAPRAEEFIGVDVSAATLDECGRQVRKVTDVPWRPVRIDLGTPESALAQVPTCDVWLSFYVFELIPSQEYGRRLLRIAHRMLTPGGLALIQVKYNNGSWLQRSRRRAYRAELASMTTYGIDEFWNLAQECGFRPEAVELVPRNELDERYAYFLLTRP